MSRRSADPPTSSAVDAPPFKRRPLVPSSAEHKHVVSALEMSVYTLHRPFLKILNVSAVDAPAVVSKKYADNRRRNARDGCAAMTEIEAWFFPTTTDDIDAALLHGFGVLPHKDLRFGLYFNDRRPPSSITATSSLKMVLCSVLIGKSIARSNEDLIAMKHATSEVAAGKGYDSIYVPSCGSGDSVSQHGHPSTTFMDTYVIFNLDCALPKYVVEYVFDPEEASRSLRQAEYEKNPYVERYNRITMEDTGHVLCRLSDDEAFVTVDEAYDRLKGDMIDLKASESALAQRFSELETISSLFADESLSWIQFHASEQLQYITDTVPLVQITDERRCELGLTADEIDRLHTYMSEQKLRSTKPATLNVWKNLRSVRDDVHYHLSSLRDASEPNLQVLALARKDREISVLERQLQHRDRIVGMLKHRLKSLNSQDRADQDLLAILDMR